MAVDIGVTIEVVPERVTPTAPTSTAPLFLLHSDALAVGTYTSRSAAVDALAGIPPLLAIADAFFNEGGRTLHVFPFVSGSGGPSLSDTLAQIPANMGPGQVSAPGIVTGADQADIASWCAETNRVYLADAADGANDAAIQALGTAIRGGTGAHFASIWPDKLIIPGSGSSTREVPASVVAAALMARNDIATGNPALAAAGTQGTCRYVLGIKSERDKTSRDALAEYGANLFADVYGTTRAYGFRTCADLTTLPHWWDLSGTRTIMAVRARAAAIGEEFMFGTVDAEGGFLARYESALAGMLAELQDVGALFGTTTDPGYVVRAGWNVNPREEVAQGKVTAEIELRVSPFAESIRITIIRRPITEGVA